MLDVAVFSGLGQQDFTSCGSRHRFIQAPWKNNMEFTENYSPSEYRDYAGSFNG